MKVPRYWTIWQKTKLVGSKNNGRFVAPSKIPTIYLVFAGNKIISLVHVEVFILNNLNFNNTPFLNSYIQNVLLEKSQHDHCSSKTKCELVNREMWKQQLNINDHLSLYRLWSQ